MRKAHNSCSGKWQSRAQNSKFKIRNINTKKTGRRDDSRARSFHFLIVSIQTHRKGIENFCNLSTKSAEQTETFNEFVVLFSK